MAVYANIAADEVYFIPPHGLAGKCRAGRTPGG